jgi:hypothetical protein
MASSNGASTSRKPVASGSIAHFRGEMTLLCLEAAEDLAGHAQPEFGDWIQSDFGWMDDVFSWSRSMRREAKAALERARDIST